MSAIAVNASLPRADAPRLTFALLLALAWALSAGQLLAQYWPATATTLPDADDAMRLVEVRAFLAGQGWFDLHEPRLGLTGYESHWSRLIDAGLAGLFLLFRLFANPALAERLMLASWPVLWLLPAIGAVGAIAWRIGGREAALIVLLLALFAGPGVQQFRPGRIDHHNVQIALTLVVIAATVWSDRVRLAALFAGAISGLALAIGFEGLPLLAFCGAVMVLRHVLTGERDALRRYGAALGAGAVFAFAVSTPSAQWFAPVCDKIAINSTLALVVVGLGIAIASAALRFGTVTHRLAVMAALGVAAVLVFALIEPRCLGGHYALVDPAVWPAWLGSVSETKPLTELMARAPATALATLAFPLLALMAVLALLRSFIAQRAFGPLAAAGALVVSVAYMIVALRGVSYAIWLGMPLVAAGALLAFRALHVQNLALRFGALILITPTALTLGTLALASAAGQRELSELNSDERAACTARPEYAALAALPPGRIALNEIEFGPYFLAWTPHSVLAGPYARAGHGPSIIASHRVFASPPDRARDAVASARVDYIVLCGSHGANGLSASEHEASLWARLRAGDTPSWLDRLQGSPGAAFAVYRVKR
jgi:hypothetical protein